jgi:hypothetical protein
VETVLGAGGGWRNNSFMDFRMETGSALLGGGIGGKACYNQNKGMGAGGFGGGGGGCAAGGGGGGFAGVYVFKIYEMVRSYIFLQNSFLCLLYKKLHYGLGV